MKTRPKGQLELICGPMFAGKTEELLRRVRRARLAGEHVLLIKPSLDTRHIGNVAVSHDSTSEAAVCFVGSEQLFAGVGSAQVIAIDEIQFFDIGIVDVALELAFGTNKRRVIVAGLDLDYTGSPFLQTAQLAAYADSIAKLSAICANCGNEASRTYKTSGGSKERIDIGGAEKYKPLCTSCFYEKKK